jgi:WD40 repeat protein
MMKFEAAVIIAALLLASPGAAQKFEVLLPNCCISSAAILVLNPQTGQIERTLNTGAQSPYRALAYALVELKNGTLAVLNYVMTSATEDTALVTFLTPATGEVTGSLTLPGNAWNIAVNPRSGVVYAGYISSENQTLRIAEINPTTLAVIKDVGVSSFFDGPLLVSPDGKRIYLEDDGSINVYSTATMTQIASIPGPDLLIGVSPDSSTIYAGSGENGYPMNSLFFIDAQIFKITQTVSVRGYLDDYYPAGAISTDGTQLFINLGTSILTVNVSTLAMQNTPMPGNDQIAGIVASANGTVYVLTYTNSGYAALLFSPESYSFTSQFELLASASVTASLTGSQLYLTIDSSPLSVPGPEPSGTIVRTALTGDTTGTEEPAGSYDPVDNLVFLPDSYDAIEILSGSTLQLKGFIPLAALGPNLYSNGAGYVAAFPLIDGDTTAQGQIVQFDPVSQTVTGTIALRMPSADNDGEFLQIATRGRFLYAPYYEFDNQCLLSCDAKSPPAAKKASSTNGSGVAVIDTDTFELVANFPVNFDSKAGFVIPAGGDSGYLSALVGNTNELIQVNLATGAQVNAVPLADTGFLVASPDGSRLYLNSGSAIEVIDVQSLSVVNSAPLTYNGISITPDGQYLYCNADAEVDIVSTSTLEVVTVIPSQTGITTPGVPIIITR